MVWEIGALIVGKGLAAPAASGSMISWLLEGRS